MISMLTLLMRKYVLYFSLRIFRKYLIYRRLGVLCQVMLLYFAVETYFKITYAIKSISGPVMLRRKNVREKIKYWVLLHMTNVGEKISRNNIIFVLNHKHYRIMYLKRYSDTQKALEIMLSYERFLFAVYGLSKYQSVDYRVALI